MLANFLSFPTHRKTTLVTVSVPATGLVTRNDRKSTKVGQRHRCEESKKVCQCFCGKAIASCPCIETPKPSQNHGPASMEVDGDFCKANNPHHSRSLWMKKKGTALMPALRYNVLQKLQPSNLNFYSQTE